MAALEITTDGSTHSGWRAGLPQLANDRVTLRELRQSDAAALYRVVRTPEVARYMWPPPPTIEAFRRFIEWTWTERAAGKYVCFGIVPHDAVDATGLFELRRLQPSFFRAELGFFIDPSWWGTGLFHEAARLMCDFTFRVLGVHRIEARTAVNNSRGNAALHKIGAQKEGVLRGAFVCDGQYVDQHLWAIVAGLDHGPAARTRHGRDAVRRQATR
jgi:ribosomal-protein-alanine N-acetyltransferase